MTHLLRRCITGTKNGRDGFCLTIILSTFLMTVACVPAKVTVTSSPSFRPSTIQKLAIFPFQTLATPQRYLPNASHTITAPTEIRSQFRLPSSQASRGKPTEVDTAKVPYLAAQRITSMVQRALEYRPGIQLVPSAEVDNIFATDDQQESTVNWKERVKQVGSRLNVDGIMIGLVRTYRERVGTKIGATPAAVGFEVHLVNPVDGRIYWTGEYYEEQKPLNEDIVGFVERSGAFVKAEDLAQYGVQKMMKQFPVGEAR